MANHTILRLFAANSQFSPYLTCSGGISIVRSAFVRQFASTILVDPKYAFISRSEFSRFLSSSIVLSSSYYHGSAYTSSGLTPSSNALVDHCSFLYLTSSTSGAAICALINSCTLSVTCCIFCGCVAATIGGSICSNTTSLDVSFCCFQSGGLSSASSGAAINSQGYCTQARLSYCSTSMCPNSSYCGLSSIMTIYASNIASKNINISQSYTTGGGIGLEHFCCGSSQCQYYFQGNSSHGTIMSVAFSPGAIMAGLEFVNNTNIDAMFWMYEGVCTVENSIFLNTGTSTHRIPVGISSIAFLNCAFNAALLSLTTAANVSFTGCEFANNGITLAKYQMLQTGNCWGVVGTSTAGFSGGALWSSNFASRLISFGTLMMIIE